jgi:hypothetical protein
MSLWMLILLLSVAIKLPLAALMLWLPFRDDEALRSEQPSSGDDDGGSKTLPQGPLGPRPRRPLPGAGPPARRPAHAAGTVRRQLRPRRGPHEAPRRSSPQRVHNPVGRERHAPLRG